MRIVWTPQALDRVSEAASFIARDKPDAAERWVEGIFAAVARIERLPELGRTVPEVRRPEIRQLVGSYRVIYRAEEQEIAVLTVRHGRRLFDQSEVEPS